MGMLRATHLAMRIGRVLATLFGLWGFYGLIHGRGWAAVMRIAVAVAVYTFAGMEYRAVLRRSRARATGFAPAFGPLFGPRPAEEEGGRVVIGPPPYRRGRGSHSELRPMRDEDE
jgi:hypothetical protein